MSEPHRPHSNTAPFARVAGGGEMGERIDAFDWSATSLGPVESWSPALRTLVRLMLANPRPMMLYWGPHYIRLYNDPYRALLGSEHPRALGRPASECPEEIWHVLQPLLDVPFHGGRATCEEDAALNIDRRGCVEEAHFTIDFVPASDESVPSGIGGVLATFQEITDRKQAEAALRQRTATLRAITETTADLVFIKDRDCRLVFANPATLHVMGMTDEQAIGVEPRRLFTNLAEGEAIWEVDRRIMASGVSETVEEVYTGPQGTRIHLSTKTPLRDEQGEIVGVIGLSHDITEKKQAEEKVRRAEAQLRVITDALPTLISYVDRDGIYRLNNRAYEEWFKHARDEITGRHMRDVLGEEAWRIIGPKVEAALAGAVVTYEAQVEYKHAGRRWVNPTYVPHVDANGEVLGVVVLVSDITHRKETEAALQAGERRLRGVAENLPRAAVFVVDRELRFRFAAGEALKEAAADGTTFEGKLVSDLMPPEEVESGVANYRRALAGIPFQVEHSTGGRCFVTHGGPLRDANGEVTAALAVSYDISDRKRAEERTRILSETAAALLTTDDPDLMLRRLFAKIGPHLKLDAYFNFMVNETGTGLKLASCVGIPEETARGIENLGFGEADCGTVAVLRRPLNATFIQQSDDPKVQLVKTFGIRAYACNPLLAGEELLGTLSFASRVRDRFNAEELDFLQTISQYVTAAYERLRLIGRLREADRRKDEFLASLAHELRNPLAPIRNGLQVLSLGGASGEAADDARRMMERQLSQMVRLIDDLLDLSRISRGKIELRKERTALADVIQQAVETSRPVIEQANHELLIDLPNRPIYIDADVTRLAQVFANLLNNAAKYTDRGGTVRLNARLLEGEVAVAIKDNGSGIPAAMLSKVFDMFTQVDRNLHRAQGGLGIGLSIVKRLVEMHGGGVEAKSDGEGLGSEFTVRLPVVASVAAVSNDEPKGNGGSARRRILVVDDNRDAAVTMAMMLKLMGNETKTAHDGLEALAAAEIFRPDLILLDIGMPRLNGYETAKRLREQSWGKEIMLVALTGWGQDDDRRKSLEAGFDAHMVKPIEPAALEKLLHSSAASSPSS